MAAFDIFYIGEDFHTVGRTFYGRYRMRVCRATLNDFQTIFYVIVIESDNMTGEEEVFDSMRSIECTCRTGRGRSSWS